jgi:putative monooxygenase ydhR
MSNTIKAFVYVEAQVSVPFEEYDWNHDNPGIRKQPGFISKTWLSGTDNNSIGGFYAFDSIENAKKYVTGFMFEKAKKLNIGITTRVFSAERVEEASKEMNSPFFN